VHADYTKLLDNVAQCSCAGSIICYQKCVANGCTCERCTRAQELQVMGNICEVTEGRTLLVITQISSGFLKKFVYSQFSK